MRELRRRKLEACIEIQVQGVREEPFLPQRILKKRVECGMDVVTDLATQDVSYSHFMIVHDGS